MALSSLQLLCLKLIIHRLCVLQESVALEPLPHRPDFAAPAAASSWDETCKPENYFAQDRFMFFLRSCFLLLLIEAMKRHTTRRAVLPVLLHLQCALSAATQDASDVAATATEAALAVVVAGTGRMTAESWA